MRKSILDRYNRGPDGKLVIDITANAVADLYNNFDKLTPYVKKELDQDLVEYLVECAMEIDPEEFQVCFHLESPPGELVSRVRESMNNYFLYMAELERRALGNMLRTSLILLVIGVLFLSLSVWLNREIAGQETLVSRLLAEGLTIVAWISLWEALANFLINWAPHRRRIRLYRRLASSTVTFA